MLKPEEASKQLATFKAPRWINQRLAKLAKLPAKIRETARIVLGRDKAGKELGWAKREKAKEGIKKTLRKMSVADRKKMFEAIFGDIAPYVERAWQMLAQAPYECDYERKAFRAPGNTDVVDERRFDFAATLCQALEGYAGHQDIEWLAAWAPHLDQGPEEEVGLLLAAAIDAGGKTGEKVLQILKESAKGEHEVGQMGRHVTRGLMCCSKPEAWEFIEKLLLAAQRQEGLRQAILETIDFAHPQAFVRMMRLIMENNLARFSATVRAIDVWFGFQWEAVSTKKVNEVIQKVLSYLENPKALQAAIAGKDPEEAFLGMWCIAYRDVDEAIPVAAKMLKDKREGKRFVAAHLLYMIGTEAALKAVVAALDDEDLRIPSRAMDCFKGTLPASLVNGDLFERFEKLIARAPEKKTIFKPIVWPWWKMRLSKEEIADAMQDALGKRPVTRLIPYLEFMSGYRRSNVVSELVKAKKFDADTRRLLLKLVTDNNCREEAISGLSKCKINEEEAAQIEGYLSRKNGDLRRGAMGLLEGQADAAALASAGRLLESRDGLQRLAGLEMLRRMVEKKRCVDAAREQARAYQSKAKPTKDEKVHLEEILDETRQAASLDDALGLLDPAGRTAPAQPKKQKVAFCTKAAREVIDGLDKLIEQHREDMVFIPDWRWNLDDDDEDEDVDEDEGSEKPVTEDGKPKGEEKPLGEVNWEFPSTRPRLELEKDLERLPLRPVWEEFWKKRPAAMRDSDGMELLRALWLNQFTKEVGDDDDEDEEDESRGPWLDKIRAGMLGGVKPGKVKHPRLCTELLDWLLRMQSPKNAVDFLLDGLESALATIPPDKLAEQYKDFDDEVLTVSKWRDSDSPLGQWNQVIYMHSQRWPGLWSKQHWARYYKLLRWWDQPTGYTGKLTIGRERPGIDVFISAFKAGACTEADVIDRLVGERGQGRWSREDFDDLGNLTASRPPRAAREIPALLEIARHCRARVIEIELKRGDSPTVATPAAKDLKCSGGLEVLANLLSALGNDKLARSTRWGDQGKPAIFSHLIRTSVPQEGDTPEAFTQAMQRIGVSSERLVEVAVYAAQWAPHVEAALGWPGLEDAVWWIHAHTRDSQWEVEAEIRRKWKAAVRQRTPLAARDLMEGAVDVAWFHQAYSKLGEAHWNQLYEAAKYASSGTGHSRARLFSDAMLERLKKSEMVARIRDKRNQDTVRALGLLPLPGGETIPNLGEAARKDLHERYKVLQEFVRTSRQFGSMRQASEKRAAAIGMQNLARTAGYPDPIRLQWAMEAEDTQDLAKGPVTAKAGDIGVALSIDEQGQPQILAQNTKTGKTLASVPSAARKDPKVAEICARKADLKRSASRVRQSLEAAMVRGDAFSGMELVELFGNPMLSPLLSRIVFIGEGILGYPVDGGRGLIDFAEKIEPVKKTERLRIAHPIDLLAGGAWDRWQHDCFARERVQPFKQIFRELYVPTKTEKAEGDTSRRYAGHQVNPRQAMALLTSRGWVTAAEEGVFHTFHDIGLVAWLTFQESFFTPAEVEGLTLEGVHFARRGEWRPMPIADVPPRIFSEVMRDMDLVVSVAHRGGVDPEASASTVEMRAALLRETCALLKLDNVRIKDNHVLIDGSLARYSVHLGSAVTHRMPGGALAIVAVHSQHRGRLFLPFADDDPKTAEVVSKVLLLARDNQIQDPNLLAQIRA